MPDDSLSTTANLFQRIVAALDLPGELWHADKYRMQSDPALLRDVVSAMAELLPPDVEMLIGLELGGVPLAVALSLHTGIPSAVLRRAPAASDAGMIAGGQVSGRRSALVVDMLQGGAKMIPAVDEARRAGAFVEYVVTAVSWLPETSAAARRADVTLLSVVDPELAGTIIDP